MRKDDKMNWPFKQEDMWDNLIEWAGKITALGEIWGALSWHVNHYKGDDDALHRHGESLGGIIRDYACFIEDTVTENMNSSLTFPIEEYQHAFEWLSESKTDIWLTADYLRRLKEFLNNEVPAVVDLSGKFEKLLKEKQEKAAATVPAAAEA